MKPQIAVVFLIFLAVFGGSPAAAGSLPGGEPYAPGVVLVGLRSGERALDLAEFPSLAAFADMDTIPATGSLGLIRLQVPPGSELLAAGRLRSSPQVAFAEPDYRVQVDDPVAISPSSTGVLPDDPAWSRQWALTKVDAPGAWAIQTGSGELIVAVIDSGVQTDHPDLADRLWRNPGEIPGNRLDDDGNGKVDDVYGWHFYHEYSDGSYEPVEDGDVTDRFGHGTHVTGILGAAGNNGLGVAGLDWGARVLTVKVLDEFGNGFYSDIVEGIEYAVDQGARLINLSLGGENSSAALFAAVQYAQTRGVLVVAAAGNTAQPVLYPAAYDGVIAVAASDALDRRSLFSNFGPQIDLAAPGEDIYSTWYLGNYHSGSGTSMATPHVTGVAALLLAQRPDLNPAQVTDILRESAEDIGAPGYDVYTGWGRLNAHRALVRLADIPDVWARLDAPLAARYGELLNLTVAYGNRGGGPAQDLRLAVELPAGLVALGEGAWVPPDLPPNTGPYFKTLPVQAVTPGVELEGWVEISTAGGETLLEDNRDAARVRVDHIFFLQLVFGP